MKEFKSDNEFDKLFQDTLKGDSITPSDNVWENIESCLDNESNKPKFIFWLSLFIGIVLIGTISFLALEKPKTANPTAENSTINQSTLSADKKTIPVSEQNSLTHLPSDTQTNSENTTDTKTETASSNTDKKENLTTSTNTTSSEPEINNTKKSVPKNEESKIVKHNVTTTEKLSTIIKAKTAKSGNTTKEKLSYANSLDDKSTSTKTENVAVTTNNTPSPSESKKENTSSKPIPKEISSNPKLPYTTLIPSKTSDDKKISDDKSTTSKTPEVNTKEIKKESVATVASSEKTTDTKTADNKTSTENKTESASPSYTNKAIGTATPIEKKDSVIAKDSVKNKADTIPKKNIVKNDAPKLIDSLVTKPTIPFAVATVYAFYSPDYFYSKPTSSQNGYDPSIEKQAMRFSAGIKVEYRPVRMIGIQIGCAYSEISQTKDESELRFSKYITAPYSIYSSLGEMQVDASIMKEGLNMLAPVDSFRFKTTYTQSVKFLNVPVNIKLNLLKSRFNVYVDAGLNTQIAIQQHSTLNLIKENFTTTIEYNDIKINHFNYSVLLGL